MNNFCRVLKSLLSFTYLTANTLFWAVPIFALGLVHMYPNKQWRDRLKQLADQCAELWVFNNNCYLKNVLGVRVRCKVSPQLSKENWYLLICNHQTWVDTVIIQKFFHKKIPFGKFFIKKKLIYIPVIGLVWKVLGFPFIDRKSKTNFKSIEKACRHSKASPSTMISFVEGTRITQGNQCGTYQHLLPPKSGGVANVIQALHPEIQTILNTTIYYPEGVPTFYHLLSGQIKNVIIEVTEVKVMANLIGSYSEPTFKHNFQTWLNQLWKEKDKRLQQLHQEGG